MAFDAWFPALVEAYREDNKVICSIRFSDKLSFRSARDPEDVLNDDEYAALVLAQ